ncbi:MAG: hypothetical protein RO257_09390 [Candidatus Kapabacteria bacterium]|nr:hypothetical protein [Candidatus Kapabacteria bacterium]
MFKNRLTITSGSPSGRPLLRSAFASWLVSLSDSSPNPLYVKKSGINYSWRNIVRIMNTQKAVSVSIKNKDKNEVIMRTCSRPTQEVLEIYRALKISSMPFKSKKFVVHH